MKQILLIGLLMMTMIIVGCTTQAPTATNPTGNTGQQVTTTPPTANTGQPSTTPSVSSKVLLADEPYANKAFLISGDTLDDAAKTAMNGFSMTKTPNGDSTTTIILTSTNPEYQNQSYTLQAGQKLYFVESSSGDDGGNQDSFLRDDRAVIVDADGYVVG